MDWHDRAQGRAPARPAAGRCSDRPRRAACTRGLQAGAPATPRRRLQKPEKPFLAPEAGVTRSTLKRTVCGSHDTGERSMHACAASVRSWSSGR